MSGTARARFVREHEMRTLRPRERTPAGPEITIETELRGPLAAKLIGEAKRRGMSPCELLAEVVELVIGDNLFAAVLD